ncbi:MAG: Ig-like domain-containing protein [Lachnospiraceae bacterium]|nr:Ig-like domain-containing protein [Lachnospiraceae bacterium]
MRKRLAFITIAMIVAGISTECVYANEENEAIIISEELGEIDSDIIDDSESGKIETNIIIESQEIYNGNISVTSADVITPVIQTSTLKCDKTSYEVGDTVTVTVEASDDVGISTIMATYVTPETNSWAYMYFTYDSTLGLYKGTMNVTDSLESGNWYIRFIRATDTSGNSVTYDGVSSLYGMNADLSGATFTIGNVEIEAESETEIETEIEIESETVIETEIESEIETELETEIESEADIEYSGTALCTEAMVISSGKETLSDTSINKNIFIAQNAELITSGNVTITGNVYVFGTLTNAGKLTVSGSVYCLHYGSMFSAGDYSYGYFNSSGSVSVSGLYVVDTYLKNGIPTVIHSSTENRILTEATCTENGLSEAVCSDCGEIISTQTITATGHTLGEWTTTKAATCATEGTQVLKCTVCGKTVNTRTIAVVAHNYGEWETTAKATVFLAETQTRSCNVCGATESKNVGSKLTPTIKVNATSIKLKVKQSTTALKVTGLADGDSIKSWKSSNTKIVTVNSKGKITAKNKTGKATITVTLASGKTQKINVTVQKTAVKTTKISGVSKTLKLKKGKTATLSPVITPITSLQKVTYSSSNKKVATVNSKGKVVAKKKGTTTITIKSGSKTFKCKVTVG